MIGRGIVRPTMRSLSCCRIAATVLSWLAFAACVQAQPFPGCQSQAIADAFADFGPTGKMPPKLRAWLYERDAQRIAPFKAFDDAWFVGACWVSAWLLPTPEGSFLIDTLHEPLVEGLLDSIRATGHDPDEIRYVFVTHGHFDHAGGMARLRRVLKNARFVMTRKGWDEAIASARASTGTPAAWQMIEPDIVANDGDTFTLGGRTVTVLETPGHTLGTASFVYDVHDGGRAFRAVTVGGLGLNAIENARQVELYLQSVDRLRALTRDSPAVQVHLTTHPFATGLMEKRPAFAQHAPGSPHPLVDMGAFVATLDDLAAGARERLVVERAREAKR
jgi:metallo-beta-lactamase class B